MSSRKNNTVVDLRFLQYFKGLDNMEFRVMSGIIINPACGKSGIYYLNANNLASHTGSQEYLTLDELKTIEDEVAIESDDRRDQRRRKLTNFRAETKIDDILEKLTKMRLIQYDFTNEIVRIVEYHKKYCPIGQAKAQIICDALVNEYKHLSTNNVIYWTNYFVENKIELEEFLQKAKEKSAKSKSERTLLTSPSFLKLQKILLVDEASLL